MKNISIMKLLGLLIAFFVLISIIPALLRGQYSFYWLMIIIGACLLLFWSRKPGAKLGLLVMLLILAAVAWNYNSADAKFHRAEQSIPANIEKFSADMLDKLMHGLNPLDWIDAATGASARETQDQTNKCLERIAYANNLKDKADRTCTLTSSSNKDNQYETCMLNNVVNGETYYPQISQQCYGGQSVQDRINGIAKNVATQLGCSKIPYWVPDWAKTLIGAGKCITPK